MSGFSWPITVRQELSPLPSKAKNFHVLPAIGIAAEATVLVVLFTFGSVFLKRHFRRKAKGKGRAEDSEADAPIEIVDREAVVTPSTPPPRSPPSVGPSRSPVPSPYPERDIDYLGGNIGSSRRSRTPSVRCDSADPSGTCRCDSAGPSVPKATYASPIHLYPCDDIDQAVHYTMVINDGKRDFVEIPLGSEKVGREKGKGEA
jgi:hypothetical protein